MGVCGHYTVIGCTPFLGFILTHTLLGRAAMLKCHPTPQAAIYWL